MKTFDGFDDFNDGFDDYITQMLNTIDMTPLFKEIELFIKSSIQLNFKQGGRFGSGKFGGGSNQWTKSKRAIAQSGQTLQDTGSMKLNVGVQVTYSNDQFDITLTAGKIYSAAHNFGHPSRPKLPARPFLVIQDKDVEDIIDIVVKYLEKHFG